MNNKKFSVRSVIAFILVLAMLVSCAVFAFSGCGGDDDKDQQQNNDDNKKPDPKPDDKGEDEDTPKKTDDPDGHDKDYSKLH